MTTKVLKLTTKNYESVLSSAARLVRAGNVVVFPTETVYGLGARIDRESALKKIFQAKGRPSDNPIIVHVATFEQLKKIVEKISSLEKKIIDKFWPGPLTIIFPKKKNISKIISGGLLTIAVRMPVNLFARDLIKKVGVPIAAPSANRSGLPSVTTGSHAEQDLVGRVPLIVDSGPTNLGIESTVIKVEGNKIFILRPGAITREKLQSFLPKTKIIVSQSKKKNLHSPGTRYRHYAPNAKLEIFKDKKSLKKRLLELKKKNIKVGILKKINLKEASKSLYHDLRKLDSKGVDFILTESYKEKGLGVAIMDRLNRAAKSSS